MRWFVPALCVFAAATAVVLGAWEGPEGGADATSNAEAPDDADPPPDLDAFRGDATEVMPLGRRPASRILDDCLRVPEGADPSLSPDPAEVDPVASGETEGVAVVVWTGPSPQYRRALGTCVAIDRGAGWTLVGRSVHRDPGPDTTSLTWQTAASAGGAGAALVGRVRPEETDLYLVLDDGRVFHQRPLDAFVAIPWQPVRDPARVVTVAGDELVYAGPLTSYGDG